MKQNGKNWAVTCDYGSRDPAPQKPGIYAVYIINIENFRKKLIYVGRAINIYSRIKNHPLKNKKFSHPYYFMWKFKITKNYKEDEVRYIKKLCPILNKQYA
jgi:excinuclease UvrABC nuclease subunit